MATEIELKLLLPAALATKVTALPWLQSMRAGPERHERLDSVYFDTPKLKLRKSGVTIRLRRSGERRVQTIKVADGGANGAFGRGEWEHEIMGSRPVLELAKGTPLEPLATKKLGSKLRPVFETAVERTLVPLRCDGAELELAIDRGRIRRYGRAQSEPISEIELEMKQGDRLALARVAERLARSLAVAYGPLSKAERGYALLEGESEKPVRARAIALDAQMSMADSFQVIGLSCLEHALANERAVRERVNRLRDHTPVAEEARILSRALESEREAALARARAALESERYRTLGLTTALWIAEGAWSRSASARVRACRARPAKAFVAETFRRRTRKLVKKARRIEDLDAAQRHELRIASKKLGYATEFFASLFSGKKRNGRRKRFRATLETFQRALGTLNDVEVHKGFAARFARPHRASGMESRKALAMGYIAGQEQRQVASCMAVLEDATGRLAGLPTFWK